VKVRTKVKAGGSSFQRNQTAARGVKVKANVKAGGLNTYNHNQRAARGLKVKSGVRAGKEPGKIDFPN
jgi:hypothetical protein